MKNNKSIIILLIFMPIILYLYLFYTNYTQKVYFGFDGVQAQHIPVQGNLVKEQITSFLFKDKFIISKMASYKINAKLLNKKYYHIDNWNELSPFDMVLGWNNMSDEKVLSKIKIWQKDRWYFWNTNNSYIPLRTIELESSNHHIIPANKMIMDKMNKIKIGQLIEMKGYLVNVFNKENKEFWKTSLTRKDIGNESCEIFYIESIEVIQ